MGADLITAVLYHPNGTILNWEAGKAAISEQTIEDIDPFIENYMMHWGADDSKTEAENDALYLAEVKTKLAEAVAEIERSITGYTRSMNSFRAMGHTFIIVGDMSWGDTPELVDEFTILGCAPNVMRAIGFTVEA